MDSRTVVKDFIKDEIDRIEFLIKSPEDVKKFPLFVELESRFTLEGVTDVLHEDAASASIAREKLRKLLADRWAEIYGKKGKKGKKGKEGSDAIFTHNSLTRANCVFVLLAHEIAKTHDKLTYELLMPSSVRAEYCYNTKGSMRYSMEFREFILAHNGVPVEIKKCFDNAVKNKTSMLFHTEEGYATTRLNDFEFYMVSEHSKEASEYYKSIKKYAETGDQSVLTEPRLKFEAVLKSDGSETNDSNADSKKRERYKVTCSYGEIGDQLLVKRILKLAQVNNLDSLKEFMQKNLSGIAEWSQFFSHIPIHDLFRITLGESFFAGIDVLQISDRQQRDKVLISRAKALLEEMLKSCGDDTDKLKAILTCQVEIYYQERKLKGANGVLKNLWGSPDMKEKLYAARALEYFIMHYSSKDDLDKAIEHFYNLYELKKENLVLSKIKLSVREGELGKLTDKILDTPIFKINHNGEPRVAFIN